jgi:alpha-glucuronidase
MKRSLVVAAMLLACSASSLRAENGYDLWMRYKVVADNALLARYKAAVTELVVDGDSPTLTAARNEMIAGLGGLLGVPVSASAAVSRNGAVLVGTAASKVISGLPLAKELKALGKEGYLIRSVTIGTRKVTVIAGNEDVGALYGAFAFLRMMQTHGSLANLNVASTPKIGIRMLDHWDNLDRSVERGYAGKSLWIWDELPGTLSPRYRDYARANASIGINGAALTNVNANVKLLTPEYIAKVAAIAGVLRPYGIHVYLSPKFSAPIDLGGLTTADPLDPAVRDWWKKKIDEIYVAIPDFGGFLVKANSEGQPGPMTYKRTHADGANMFADALAPHGGIVMWRAFVYGNGTPEDRPRQAYDEFKPLDGQFRDNVVVQVKNGPLDFQPREPFSPLFGAMAKTPLVMEFQITKEYLGQDTHLVYLGPMFEETLRADTYAKGKGSTIAKVIDGSLYGNKRTGIAGVANVGSDTNWTGSQFNQANWYAFGRFAWDPMASSANVADEWIRMTLSNDAKVVSTVEHMMLVSREAVVNYMTPLGLVHIMATGHHYGPGMWANLGHPDVSPTYYHSADSIGIGVNRTSTGSNYVAQYFPPLRDRYENKATLPDSVLLFIRHVPWGEKLRSGRTMWDEIVYKYNEGVDSVRSMQRAWNTVQPAIDPERFSEVRSFLDIQEKEARWWRDAGLTYFQTFSKMPIPAKYERPAHPLAYYETLRCPKDRNKPRCDDIP